MTSIADHDVDAAEAATSRPLKAAEVAALFCVSPRTISRWADAGLLACTRTLGGVSGRGHRRFAEDDVQALLAGQPS